MASTPGRIAATFLVCAAASLLLVSLFLPWWGLGREAEGAREWQRHGPFERDARAEDGAFAGETSTLGLLAAGGLLLLALAATLQVRHAFGSGRGFMLGALVTLAGTLAAFVAVLYVVVAFPQEANDVQGTDLTFADRSCSQGFGVDFCYITRPDLGWYLASAATLMGALGLVAGRVGRPDGETVARPVLPARPMTTPGSAAPVVTAQGRRLSKCPQCQTKLGGTGPAGTVATCHNCGLRFPL